MSKQVQQQICVNDVGVPIEIDTELTDLTGFTLEIEFYNAAGVMKKRSTAAAGGDGPIGKLVTYTTVAADISAGVHATPGRWAQVIRITKTGVERRSTPPVYVTVVAQGD